MVFQILFRQLPAFSRPLFVVVIAVILIQLYSNVQFARLANIVDSGHSLNKPILFECFPFVVYNMYSGKIADWGHYGYLKIIADGRGLPYTDYSVLQIDQIINPIQRYLKLKTTDFRDDDLRRFVHYLIPTNYLAQSVYYRTSNEFLAADETAWSHWLKNYLSKQLGYPVHQVQIVECSYAYNAEGKPYLLSEKPIYSTP